MLGARSPARYLVPQRSGLPLLQSVPAADSTAPCLLRPPMSVPVLGLLLVLSKTQPLSRLSAAIQETVFFFYQASTFGSPAQPARHKNDVPRASGRPRLFDCCRQSRRRYPSALNAIAMRAMPARRPPRALAEDRAYNADFILRFTQREAARRNAKRPAAFTAEQRAGCDKR